jgi:hypothetical protein
VWTPAADSQDNRASDPGQRPAVRRDASRVIQGVPIVAVNGFQEIRMRLLPMLQAAALRYANRVPNGYPSVVDSTQPRMVGLEIDPSHALYIVDDGNGLAARIYRRAPRTDNRSSAGWEKFAGQPFSDRRPLGADVSDQELRNLISEVMHWYNFQPGLLYITDD